MWEVFADARDKKATFSVEARYRRYDGAWHWVTISGKPAVDGEGNILKWYGTSTDIHDLVVKRRKANHEKSQFLEILDHAQVGVFKVCMEYNVYAVLGESFPQMREFKDNVAQKLKDPTSTFASSTKEILSGNIEHVVFEEQFKDKCYRLRLARDIDYEGEEAVTVGVLGFFIDITEQRQHAALEADNVRLQAERQMETEKSNLKSSFLAHMSHEVRTTIAGVLGMAEILSDSKITPEQRSLVECIQISAGNLLAIVNDILDLSKVEAGRMELEEVPFDLENLLAQTVGVVEAKATTKGLQIHQGKPPESHMVGDPGRISQILLNLLSNAIKITNKGFVTLSITAQHNSIIFSVKDTGIGIDEATQAHLFQPFT